MSTTHRGQQSRQNVYLPSAALEALRRTDDGRVFVINTSDLDGRREKGAINMGITMRNGETRNVVVPNTWIPIDLAQQMPKDELLNSPPFLTNVQRRVIMLLDSATAEEMLEDSNNQDEQDRLFQEQMSLLNPEQDIDANMEQRRRDRQRVPQDEEDDGNPALEGVSPKIQEAVGRDDLTPQQRFSIVKNNEGTLTAKDLSYIMQNSDDQRLVDLASSIMQSKGLMRQVGGGRGYSADAE